jgi:hypothetical protein
MRFTCEHVTSVATLRRWPFMMVRDMLMWGRSDLETLFRTVFIPGAADRLTCFGRMVVLVPMSVITVLALLPMVPFIAVTVALRTRSQILGTIQHSEVPKLPMPRPSLVDRIGDTIHLGPDPGFSQTCRCLPCREEVARRRTPTYRLVNAATTILVIIAGLAALAAMTLLIRTGVAVWTVVRGTASDLWFALKY